MNPGTTGPPVPQEVFAQVRVNSETGTIEWPNGADLAPEFLYDQGTEAEHVA